MAKADNSSDNPLAGIVPGPQVTPVPEPPAVLVAYSYEQLRAHRLQGQPYIARANCDELQRMPKMVCFSATRTSTWNGCSGYRQTCENQGSHPWRSGLSLTSLIGQPRVSRNFPLADVEQTTGTH
jgi:hypothetical protein